MLHFMLRDLQGRGHDVSVLTTDADAPELDIYDGIPIRRATSTAVGGELRRASVLVTQLRVVARAAELGRTHGVPVVFIEHANGSLQAQGITSGALAIHNSKNVAATSGFTGPSMILYPPVDPDDYRVVPGDCITQIHLGMWKGGNVFWRLVDALPDHRFLAKKGGYLKQIVPSRVPPNAELVADGLGVDAAEMRQHVYSRTRVLLMPSAFEQWGRVAIEAACSGIPVIAHPAEGLVESLGSSGIFVDRDDTLGWVQAVRALDDAHHYTQRSAAVLMRAHELWDVSKKQLDELEGALLRAGDSLARL